jgi:hypothetical protein
MTIRRSMRSLIRLVYALIIIGTPHTTAAVAAPNPPPVQLLSSAILGRPFVAERAVFWSESRGNYIAILGYDLAAGAPFVIAERAGTVLDLAADDTLVVWAERDPKTSQLNIFGFDRRAGTLVLIKSLAGSTAQSEIALDRGVLYYTDSARGHSGLFALDLATKRERLVSIAGIRPVARDGRLLWSEAQAATELGRAIWSLHLRTADGHYAHTVLARRDAGYLGFSGYDIAGGVVAWSFAASVGDSHIYIYNIDADTTTALAAGVASDPHIHDRSVIWAETSVSPSQPAIWRVRAYHLANRAQSLAVEESGAATTVWGVAGQERLVLTVAADPQSSEQALYLSDLQAHGVSFAAKPVSPGIVPAACTITQPITCGQVRLAGAALYDDGGSWRMRGVQFILPQFGINAKTFRTDNYAAARVDGSLDYWLEKARHYLRTNILRIFVDLPDRQADGTLFTPTDYATLFDFAARANARGMRLAIVPHNSADWSMTADRSSWIAGLIDYFSARDGLPMIAYLSADNEINNHCGRAGKDCFDSDSQYNAQPYIDGAIDWTAQFRAIVKSRAPQLLVTVGVSTEMQDIDSTRGAFNFFRPDSRGRTLASTTDLLAPHNFGGGAASIIDDLRYGGYRGAIVLEEYGYPTDPYPRSSYWTEGQRDCRIDPTQAVCALTAPFFVETNIQALRTKSYAGSSAWMIADMREKDAGIACSSDSEKPFDLWTGLFAIGGTYCDGGTYSRAAGQPKATAVRVCAYYADDLALCEPGVPPKRRMYFPAVRVTKTD